MDANTRASQKLHQNSAEYGNASSYLKEGSFKYHLTIPQALEFSSQKTTIKSLLDYGCGKGGLLKALSDYAKVGIIVDGYDPSVPEYSEEPSHKYDIITCIDVLEHLSRDNLRYTLEKISHLTIKYFFFCIDLVPASKKLDDGRNAHTLIAPPEWWCQQIKQTFQIASFIEVGHLPDESRYPMHLLGCASNSMNSFNAMNTFLENVRIARTKSYWVDGKMIIKNYE